jgi:molybdate transport system substrate-binding protein
MRVRKWLLVGAALLMVAIMGACGDDDGADNVSPTATVSTASSDTGPTPTRTPVDVPIEYEVTVFAASSLTEALTQIADDFEHLIPGVGVNLQFGGSQDLRAQIEQGAEADIFISADRTQMELLAQSGLIGGQRFVPARNKLVIIVPKANEANITSPQDLANPGLKVILGGENVPIGNYSRLFLEAASESPDFSPDYSESVLANVVSETTNVKELAAAVALDEVDAGIVYATDVTPDIAEDVTVIEIPDDVNQVAQYSMSLTVAGIETAYAQEFIDYTVNTIGGQETLVSFGFMEGN